MMGRHPTKVAAGLMLGPDIGTGGLDCESSYWQVIVIALATEGMPSRSEPMLVASLLVMLAGARCRRSWRRLPWPP